MRMIEFINSLPDYFGKGLLQLLIITAGGLIVGWITSTIFARKNEINAVEGTLLKRKLDIYEELNKRVEFLRSMEIIPAEVVQAAVTLLKDAQVDVCFSESNRFFKLFIYPDVLKEEFLQLDEFISTKRIYFDDKVLLQAVRFSNYFAVLRRLQVMYEGHFVDAKISLEASEVKRCEQLLVVQLGLVFQDEFNKQIDKLVGQIKDSIQNLSFAHRSETDHTYDYYNSLEGPVMSELKNTILLSKCEEISEIVANTIAAGEASHVVATQKKKK